MKLKYTLAYICKNLRQLQENQCLVLQCHNPYKTEEIDSYMDNQHGEGWEIIHTRILMPSISWSFIPYTTYLRILNDAPLLVENDKKLDIDLQLSDSIVECDEKAGIVESFKFFGITKIIIYLNSQDYRILFKELKQIDYWQDQLREVCKYDQNEFVYISDNMLQNSNLVNLLLSPQIYSILQEQLLYPRK